MLNIIITIVTLVIGGIFGGIGFIVGLPINSFLFGFFYSRDFLVKLNESSPKETDEVPPPTV